MNFGDFILRIQNYWNLGNLNIWAFGDLYFGNFEILGIQKFADLKFWNSENLKFLGFGSGNFFWNFNFRDLGIFILGIIRNLEFGGLGFFEVSRKFREFFAVAISASGVGIGRGILGIGNFGSYKFEFCKFWGFGI